MRNAYEAWTKIKITISTKSNLFENIENISISFATIKITCAKIKKKSENDKI